MSQLVAIALGGSVGAVFRFLVANAIYNWLGRDFPHGTLFINVSGSFLMGFLSILMLQCLPLAVEYRAAILVGFLGAYTTFSTFALETLNLFESGSLLKAGLNIFLSIVLCLVAVWVGSIFGRQLFETAPSAWLEHALPYRMLMLWLIVIGFVALVAEVLFLKAHLTEAARAISLVVLLGLGVVTTTLWLHFKLAGSDLGFGSILSIFVINTLCGVMAIWLGLTSARALLTITQ